MENLKSECYHPICMLAHELLNSLSVIVGHCDLLGDPDGPEGTSSAKHLQVIRDTATAMAQKLSHRQCDVASMARSVAMQKETSIEETSID